MISNHFVFKAKVESIFEHSTIRSTLLYQFLIDALSNLPQLTFILSSLLFFKDDNSLSTMIYSDMSWVGIFLSIVAFKNIMSSEENNSRIMLLKSVIFLVLVYLTIAFHYAVKLYMVSIGLALMLFYVLNLLANGYEDSFVAGIEYLFGYKPH